MNIIYIFKQLSYYLFILFLLQKEKTKGQKQILEENASTVFYYRVMSLVAVAVYMACCWLLFNLYSSTDQVCSNI